MSTSQVSALKQIWNETLKELLQIGASINDAFNSIQKIVSQYIYKNPEQEMDVLLAYEEFLSECLT